MSCASLIIIALVAGVFLGFGIAMLWFAATFAVVKQQRKGE